MDALMHATYEDLVAVHEVGEKMAESICAFFSSPANLEIIQRLAKAGLKMQAEQSPLPQDNALGGKTFVVSGVFSAFSRDGIKDKIARHGGKVSGSLSGKTDFLVAGQNMGPEKRKKAEALGIPIISEQDLIQMLNP